MGRVRGKLTGGSGRSGGGQRWHGPGTMTPWALAELLATAIRSSRKPRKGSVLRSIQTSKKDFHAVIRVTGERTGGIGLTCSYVRQNRFGLLKIRRVA